MSFFAQGYAAYTQGYRMSFCPFVVGTVPSEQWIRGWEAARAWARSARSGAQ